MLPGVNMKKIAIFTRLGAGAMLMIVWGLYSSSLSGVIFLLIMTALSAIRYRLTPYKWLMYAEISTCILFSFTWMPALLGLWLPVISVLENRWDIWEKDLLRKAHEDRSQRLKLEENKENTAREMKNAARVAEMAERSRIAQDIHDHVGHEISGASIALQTAIKLFEKNDAQAKELLNQSAKRLETASIHLREAVHNLKPSRTIGIETLKDLCDDFTFCKITFESTGDINGVFYWELLASNLKESLTNITRHSNATQVIVKLEGNRDFVRMQISDNGQIVSTPKMGLGLSGIQQRVRTIGGTFTVNTDNGFSVITFLPKR